MGSPKIRVKILIEADNEKAFEDACLELPSFAFAGPEPVMNVSGSDSTVVMRPLREDESSWFGNAYNLP